VCAGPFLRASTIPAYVHAIENFSVRSAKCDLANDHKTLHGKVCFYYESVREG